jgi:hypothetical protein
MKTLSFWQHRKDEVERRLVRLRWVSDRLHGSILRCLVGSKHRRRGKVRRRFRLDIQQFMSRKYAVDQLIVKLQTTKLAYYNERITACGDRTVWDRVLKPEI